ncbi:MAG: hypothetical protein JW870_21560 [Candidatus Delongbacteria bacterium]|nr:hypothetical protein [Candidatus Delongbacteria bacterium]
MKKIFLMLLGLILLGSVNAQSPIGELGMLSLSNGRYDEVHEYTQYERIGSAIIDMETMKIVSFIDSDSMKGISEIDQIMTTRFLSVDPMARKYPEMNPYGYCANNPILYVDPDGRDLVIWYNNNQNHYRYTGGEVNHPNKFVNSVINAYNYNVSNGGGAALKAAATDRTVNVGITEFMDSKSWKGNVYWNSEMGLKTIEGDVLSPATVLEHEVDHAYNKKTDPSGHEERKNTYDPNYTNAEEKRVIEGNETTTAKANGEIGDKNLSRSSHRGNSKVIIVGGVSSTKINQQKSDVLNKNLEEQRGKWSSEY